MKSCTGATWRDVGFNPVGCAMFDENELYDVMSLSADLPGADILRESKVSCVLCRRSKKTGNGGWGRGGEGSSLVPQKCLQWVVVVVVLIVHIK